MADYPHTDYNNIFYCPQARIFVYHTGLLLVTIGHHLTKRNDGSESVKLGNVNAITYASVVEDGKFCRTSLRSTKNFPLMSMRDISPHLRTLLDDYWLMYDGHSLLQRTLDKSAKRVAREN